MTKWDFPRIATLVLPSKNQYNTGCQQNDDKNNMIIWYKPKHTFFGTKFNMLSC